MKAYLLCTGSIFGLIGVTHGVRLFVEGGHTLSGDPGFFAVNAALFFVGTAVATWSVLLLRRRSGISRGITGKDDP